MATALTSKDVGIQQNVSTSTVRRWLNKGLPYYKIGNTIRINPDDLEIFLGHFKRGHTVPVNLQKKALTNPLPIIINMTKGGKGDMAIKAKNGRLTFVHNSEIINGTVYQRKNER